MREPLVGQDGEVKHTSAEAHASPSEDPYTFPSEDLPNSRSAMEVIRAMSRESSLNSQKGQNEKVEPTLVIVDSPVRSPTVYDGRGNRDFGFPHDGSNGEASGSPSKGAAAGQDFRVGRRGSFAKSDEAELQEASEEDYGDIRATANSPLSELVARLSLHVDRKTSPFGISPGEDSTAEKRKTEEASQGFRRQSAGCEQSDQVLQHLVPTAALGNDTDLLPEEGRDEEAMSANGSSGISVASPGQLPQNRLKTSPCG